MVCLIEFLFWQSTGKEYKCEGESCRFYGCGTCHAKGDGGEQESEIHSNI